MAKTPFIDLKSEDILSAHISGIQHSINKLENVLNLQTATKTGHALIAVEDQADATLHHFIYEGTIRNWLTVPAPVVKRDGVVVPNTEYVIQPAYGVVVFNTQQDAVYNITADFTHVDGVSGVITGLDNRVSTNENGLVSVGNRVTALEGVPSSGGMSAALPPGQLIPRGEYLTNFRDMSDGQTMHTTLGVAMAGNTIDAQPFYLYEKTTISKIKFSIGENASPAGNVIVGIYSNLNTAPEDLLANTAVIPVAATSTVRVEYDIPLVAEVTLEAGLYWVARYQSVGIKPVGADAGTKCILIKPPVDSTLLNASGSVSTGCIGVRTTSVGSISVLPAKFNRMASTTCQYLKRDSYGVTWLYKKL